MNISKNGNILIPKNVNTKFTFIIKWKCNLIEYFSKSTLSNYATFDKIDLIKAF